jgi:alpha-beta hydrolase superfamily lysophospholipase
MNKIIRHAVLLIGNGLLFLVIGGLTVYVYLGTRYTAEPWHEVQLNGEYSANQRAEVPDFATYLQLEERLFQELRKNIYQIEGEAHSSFNRYKSGSLSDPSTFAINWNKSFEMKAKQPRGGVLMLHGLTDSPYSVRALAKKLHTQGYWVVGLRLPGHGTIPAELTRISWQDWAAATRLGARYLQEQLGPTQPFYIMGHSTGGSLAVEYCLSMLGGEKIPEPAGLILLSPAIGLTPLAALAELQLLLADLPGLGKMAWESVMMEYDPYKYNSFPVNAGKQIYLLTKHIQTQFEDLAKNGKLASFPRVLAFQSIVDSTIAPGAIVDKFLNRLPPAGGHNLVLYDVNQRALAEGLLNKTGKELKTRLTASKDLPFALTFVTNVVDDSNAVQAVQKKAMQSSMRNTPLSLAWPQGIHSLSHVALPFPPNDPIYGDLPIQGAKHIRLGKLAIYGEKGVFAIPEKDLMRLRYNPFFSYMEERIRLFFEEASSE